MGCSARAVVLWREFSDEPVEIGELLRCVSDTKRESKAIAKLEVSPLCAELFDRTRPIRIELPEVKAPLHRPHARARGARALLVAALLVGFVTSSSSELEQCALRFQGWAFVAAAFWKAEIFRAVDRY
jgi:hypothetical protein